MASRIEICGGIASGKTTLARVLAKAGLEPTFERFRANPFWRDFCANPSSCSFETEVTFLLQHYHAAKRKHGGLGLVCDFSFLLDQAYAGLNLRGSRRSAFLALYDEIVEDLGPPRVLVHLKCTARTEFQRIKKRGRREERSLSVDYLSAVNHAVERLVSKVGEPVGVLAVDSDRQNFDTSKRCQRDLTAAVLAEYNS
ncbi:MAG: deoxynucleoside kinase [Candidatus Binataceae bacterium]